MDWLLEGRYHIMRLLRRHKITFVRQLNPLLSDLENLVLQSRLIYQCCVVHKCILKGSPGMQGNSIVHPSKENQSQVQFNKKNHQYPTSFKESEQDLIPRSKCLSK